LNVFFVNREIELSNQQFKCHPDHLLFLIY
jgi:hypothetical protein